MIKHRASLIFSTIQMNFGSSTLAISQADGAIVNSTSYDAVDLAYRISNLSTFLSAAHELIFVLSGSKYVTTRKTIRLLELARKTLERAGIIPYSFASCHKSFVAHKEAYIDLLKMLRAENWQDNTELRGRIRILLMPLTSNFSIQKRYSSVNSRSTSLKRHSSCSRTTGASFCFKGDDTKSPDASSPAAQPATMLPPDAFPTVINPQASVPIRRSPIERFRAPLWDYRQLEKSSTSKRLLDQENIVVQSGKYRPPKRLRQFGIYCTKRSSMDNCRRSERLTLVL